MRRGPAGVAMGVHGAAQTHVQSPQTTLSLDTDSHTVHPPHGSLVKHPHARVPLQPAGIGMHSGGTSQHPAHRPRMQIFPGPHGLVPHTPSPPTSPAASSDASLAT